MVNTDVPLRYVMGNSTIQNKTALSHRRTSYPPAHRLLLDLFGNVQNEGCMAEHLRKRTPFTIGYAQNEGCMSEHLRQAPVCYWICWEMIF